MSKAHHSAAYVAFRSRIRPSLLAALPGPCARCGQVMTREMTLELDHIIPVDVRPDLLCEPANCRLVHRLCNRRAGQKITVQKKQQKAKATRLPSW